MSSAFDLGNTGQGLVDPIQSLLSSLPAPVAGPSPIVGPMPTVPDRLNHLAALHRAGLFDPNAGPASSAIAAHVMAHALAGGGLSAAGPELAPMGGASAPQLAPSGQVTIPGNDLGSQSPGQSYMDQVAQGIAASPLASPNGYQSNGDQFLTALLGGAARSFASAQGQDMSDRQKLEDAMSTRTSDLNRRNLDLADKKDLLATESGLQAKNEATRIGLESKARTAEDAAKQAAGMVTVDRTLANIMGHPEMTGTKIDADLRDRLIEVAAQRRTAAGGGAAGSQGTKEEQLRYRVLSGRIEKMDAADARDLQILSNPTTPKDVRAATWAKVTARDGDRKTVQGQISDIEQTWLTRAGGGKTPAAAGKAAAPAKAPGVLTPDVVAGGLLNSGIRTPDQFRSWLLLPSSADPGKTNAEHAEAIGVPPQALLDSWQKAISTQAANVAAVAARGQASRRKVDALMFPQTPLPAESERGAPGPLSRE